MEELATSQDAVESLEVELNLLSENVRRSEVQKEDEKLQKRAAVENQQEIISALEVQLNSSLRKREDLLKKETQLKEEYERSKVEMKNSSEAAAAEVRGELEAAAGERCRLLAELDELVREFDGVKQEKKAAAAECAKLRGEVATLETCNSDLNDACTAVEVNKNKVERALAEKNESLKSTKKHIRKLERDAASSGGGGDGGAAVELKG